MFATRGDKDLVRRSGSNRAINRHKWCLKTLERALASTGNLEGLVFDALKKILSIRRCQPAFHPNATQFILELEDTFFGVWRQSIDRHQSIVAITNVTNMDQALDLTTINLVLSDQWNDLLSDNFMSTNQRLLNLLPYQTVWLSNHDMTDS